MAVSIPIDSNQPKNKLSSIADEQRKKNFVINDYKTTNEYTSTNPDAMADGDSKGKGTGIFLDTSNESAGAIEDIMKRKEAFAGAKFKPTSPYTTPSA